MEWTIGVLFADRIYDVLPRGVDGVKRLIEFVVSILERSEGLLPRNQRGTKLVDIQSVRLGLEASPSVVSMAA